MSKNVKPNASLFRGCMVLFAPFGSMTRTRCSIMAKNVKMHGGSVAKDVTAATHIVVSSNARVFDGPQCPLRAKIREHVDKVVSEEWYHQSLSMMQCLDENRFRLQLRGESSAAREDSFAASAPSDQKCLLANSISRNRLAVYVPSDQEATGSTMTPKTKRRRVDSILPDMFEADNAPSDPECQRDNSPFDPECQLADSVSPDRIAASSPSDQEATGSTMAPKTKRQRVDSILPKRPRVVGGRTVAPIHAFLTPQQQKLMRNAAKGAFAFTRLCEPSEAKPLNTDLIAQFSTMATNVDQKGAAKNVDQFRARAYRKAATVLCGLDYTVTLDNIHRLKERGIGKKSLDKIEEFLRSGSIRRAEALQNDPRRQALLELQKIWGVGRATAEGWYARKICTLHDVHRGVKDRSLHLSANQLIGLQYVEDFNLKIPRAEVQAIYDKVKKCAETISEFTVIECVGSFRRQRTECGDIDMLFCSLPTSDNHNLMRHLISLLEEIGLLTHRLQNYKTLDMDSEHTSASFMGVCQLPGYPYHRRIDIKIWPQDQYAYALLHFTGDAYFNRSLRLYAKKLGYALSDHGLRAMLRDDEEKTRVAQAKSFLADTEEDIFNALGLTYVPPEKRTIAVSLISQGCSAEIEDKLQD